MQKCNANKYIEPLHHQKKEESTKVEMGEEHKSQKTKKGSERFNLFCLDTPLQQRNDQRRQHNKQMMENKGVNRLKCMFVSEIHITKIDTER